MQDQEPTVRSRELGDGLRRAMEKAKLTGSEAAHQLGWSQSWVSRLLNGKRTATAVDVSAFLALCRVTGAERARLLALCGEQHTEGWLQQHGDRLPEQVQTLINHENVAIKIREYQSTMVTGLLQTGDYARAVISRNVNVPEVEIEDRVDARLARQSLFTRDRPARFTFFMHEFVLRLPIGGPAVMSEQLHHLLRMSVRPNVTIRVIPAALGEHAALAGTFKLLEFVEFRPVAYLDSETSSLFLEKTEEITAYQRVLAALADVALNEGESRELIASLATELYSTPEGPDDHA